MDLVVSVSSFLCDLFSQMVIASLMSGEWIFFRVIHGFELINLISFNSLI